MTIRFIRAFQYVTSHEKIQKRFPKPTEPKCVRYKQERESERRRRQIAKGSLKAENGLLPEAIEVPANSRS